MGKTGWRGDRAGLSRWLPAAALAVVLCLTLSALADAKPKRHPVSVKLTKKSKAQERLLRSKVAVVRVRAAEPGRLRVGVRTRVKGEKGKRKLTKTRAKRVKRKGVVKVRVRLTKRGIALAGDCGPRTLLPFARLKTDARKVRRAHSKVPLRRDENACYIGPPIDTTPVESDEGPVEVPIRACDFLDPSECLYPFPNDRYTAADASSTTGRRVNFNALAMPRNIAQKPADTAELNRNDGFSPGSSIILKIPGLDTPAAFAKTGLVPQTDIARYADADQPAVVIDTVTGKRWPIFAELDSNPPERTPGNTDDVTLMMLPAVNFTEGHRYVVALRNLKDADGKKIPAKDSFRVYRDKLRTEQPEIESRRPQMEKIFSDLKGAGIGRSDLYLAWDFTVASRENLSDRMLHIRDDAFAQLGDTNLADGQVQGSSPALTNLQATDLTIADDSRIARTVTGNVTVPCYMNTPGCSPAGSTFNYPLGGDADRLPEQLPGNTASVGFTCIIPRSSMNGPMATGLRPSLYGHGLLGSQGEVEGGNVKAMAFESQMMFCATDWYGFATTNVPNVLLILQDISNFPLLGDETQQGMLNFLFLGRAMIHPNGFNANAAFQGGGGAGVVDTSELFYDGNSQGGILGGSLTAVAPDFRACRARRPGDELLDAAAALGRLRAVRRGQVHATICDATRPADLPAAGGLPLGGLYDNYPDELERPLIFALLQMQWDRAEANGYAAHMTDDPLPNTPTHQVLLHAAFGDHQVANVTAEVEARTIGAGVYQPALDPGRHSDVDPYFGIPPITFPRRAAPPTRARRWCPGTAGRSASTRTGPRRRPPPTSRRARRNTAPTRTAIRATTSRRGRRSQRSSRSAAGWRTSARPTRTRSGRRRSRPAHRPPATRTATRDPERSALGRARPSPLAQTVEAVDQVVVARRRDPNERVEEVGVGADEHASAAALDAVLDDLGGALGSGPGELLEFDCGVVDVFEVVPVVGAEAGVADDRRLHPAGVDVDRAHPGLAQLLPQRVGVAADGELRRAVGALMGEADQAEDARGVDDRARVLGEQDRQERAHPVDDPAVVDLADPLVVLG